MSDQLIASLQRRIDELTGEKATLSAEAKDRRIANKKLRGENATLQGQVETLTTERDDFKVKAEAGPGQHAARIAELEGQLRGRDHRDAFAGVREFEVAGEDGTKAKYTLNDGVTHDDVWGAIAYKPEGDVPDASKITGLLTEARGKKGFLFKPAGETPDAEAGASQQPNPNQRREPGPGSGTRVLNPPGSSSVLSIVQADYAKSAPGRTIPGRL